jgi:family
MGATRNNQPRKVTEEKIRILLRRQLAMEQTVFPSERELAIQTGGSRSVIHKILKEMEHSNRLIQTPNGRIINTSANKVPVLFITSGRDAIANPAWARLWMVFSEKLRAFPLTAELFLLRFWPEEIEEDLQKLAERKEQYIIVTSPDSLSDQIAQWRGEGRQVIFPDQIFEDETFPMIAVDNIRIGELAAEELFRHGFRSPALLTPNFVSHSYLPYQKRIEGFSRKCRELGMRFDREKDVHEALYHDGKGIFQNYIRESIELAENPDYDSMFLTSDDQLPLVLDTLNVHGRIIPGCMGVITLNANNYARSATTCVNSISNATEEIAEHLCSGILAHADGRASKVPTTIIEPVVYGGRTLTRIKRKDITTPIN